VAPVQAEPVEERSGRHDDSPGIIADVGGRHERPALVYDGDCGFCSRCARWAIDRFRTEVPVVPWQAYDLAAVGLTEADVRAASYWVHADGTTSPGHLGVAQALLAMRGGWPLLGRLLLVWPVRVVAQVVYRVVARNRYRLPGSTDACKL
jgi:predicted DCC family thiol-disulfide oxidoreductase YuxK